MIYYEIPLVVRDVDLTKEKPGRSQYKPVRFPKKLVE